MDALGQLLDPHAFVEARVFTIETRQYALDGQVQVIATLELGQGAQQLHRIGLIDPDGEEEQQVIGTCLLHHYAALVEELGDQGGRQATLKQLALTVHPRGQQRDLDGIQVHVVIVDAVETVPVIFGIQLPALDCVYVVRLPYIEEPAFALITQPLDLLAKGDCAIDGVLDQTLAAVAPHHGGGDLGGRHYAILRRCGGVHHKGFVEGLFLNVTLDVDHRGLGEGRQ